MRTEFAVVGGGLAGLATAWALRRGGREVVVIEQAAIGHLGGGSHGACRIFRLGYDDREYVALAAVAREAWAGLEQACGVRLLHPAPQVTFGPLMPAVHEAMRAAGAACEMLTEREAGERFPAVTAAGPVLLEPESAVIAADLALAGLAGLAGGDHDGSVRCGVTVTAVADDGRRVRLSTTAGDVDAGCAIVCAGPWTSALLATAGIAVPSSATLEQVAYLAPAAGHAPPASAGPPVPIFVHYGGEFPYGLPVPGSDRYKIGIHHGGPAVDPGRQHQAADDGLSARTERAARAILPGFDPRPVAVERCVYDNSPDEDFIVDRIGNVVIGSGTSGHGFKFGPLLGEWLAGLAVTGRPQVAWTTAGAPPARFALSRFR